MNGDEMLRRLFLTPAEKAELLSMEPPTHIDLHETTNRLLKDLCNEVAALREVVLIVGQRTRADEE